MYQNTKDVQSIKSKNAWILCLILSIGLSHLLTKSFVTPLLNLQEGALAIENRNFKHRLSNLNVDEFGEVGGIFNHVMVGLEELEIAKNSQLIPVTKFICRRLCPTLVDQ